VQRVCCVIRLVNVSFLQDGPLPKHILLSILKICCNGPCIETATGTYVTDVIFSILMEASLLGFSGKWWYCC